jgi:muconolactone delta-isomerase
MCLDQDYKAKFQEDEPNRMYNSNMTFAEMRQRVTEVIPDEEIDRKFRERAKRPTIGEMSARIAEMKESIRRKQIEAIVFTSKEERLGLLDVGIMRELCRNKGHGETLKMFKSDMTNEEMKQKLSPLTSGEEWMLTKEYYKQKKESEQSDPLGRCTLYYENSRVRW